MSGRQMFTERTETKGALRCLRLETRSLKTFHEVAGGLLGQKCEEILQKVGTRSHRKDVPSLNSALSVSYTRPPPPLPRRTRLKEVRTEEKSVIGAYR